MSAKKYIILPDWVTALKDRQSRLEDELRKITEKILHFEVAVQKSEVIAKMEEDIKSLS